MALADMVQNAQKEGAIPEAGPGVKALVDQATTLLYDEHFQDMLTMFKDPDNFPNAMSTVINGVLARIEKDNGEQSFEDLAQVAMEVFRMLAEDLVQGGMLQEITGQMAMQAMQQTLSMWVRQNQKRVDGNEVAEALKMMKEQVASEMASVDAGATDQPVPAPSNPAMGGQNGIA